MATRQAQGAAELLLRMRRSHPPPWPTSNLMLKLSLQANNPIAVTWDPYNFAHELGHGFGAGHTHGALEGWPVTPALLHSTRPVMPTPRY